MIWFLWTAGIGVGLVVLTAVAVSWWQTVKHRRAVDRRISEYLEKLRNE